VFANQSCRVELPRDPGAGHADRRTSRARLTLTDGSHLEFSEYVQRSTAGQVNVVTYSYHWADAYGDLIRRWDNTPHFPDLPGSPHHIHDGHTGKVSPGQPVSIFVVLEEVARLLA